MKKRFLALILALAMTLSILPATAMAAGEKTADKDKYVTLDGDWHFKLYRRYTNMFQYETAYPAGFKIDWEDNELAKVPDENTFSQWEVFKFPADDVLTGGLLPQSRPVAPASDVVRSMLPIEDEEEAEIEVMAEEIAEVEETATEVEEEVEEAAEVEETEEAEEEAAPAEEETAEEEAAETEEVEEALNNIDYNPSWLFPTWSEAWACRTFELPENFTSDETVTLLMGIIDDADVIYINGTPVASSGFMDGSRKPVLNDLELGGFKRGVIDFEKSYWEIEREYKVPASVLKTGKNVMQIRVFNNNSLGGFYSDKIYALCGNEAAVRNLKGLTTDVIDGKTLSGVVAAQNTAIEAGDVDAYAATISDTFANNEVNKAAYVANMAALVKDKTGIKVTDENTGFYNGDGFCNYAAKRTITSDQGVLFSGTVELFFHEVKGQLKERGNWSHCYTTGYTSELFHGERRTYSVYLPPSYYENPTVTYPVVYLLHGQNSSSTSYIKVDGIEAFMDKLIKSGEVIDMIVVMPDSGKNAFYKDSDYVAKNAPNHDSDGPWASQLVNELRPEVERNYRTMNAPEFRGLTGNSMGGGGSFYLGCSNPDIFSSVASHMGFLPTVNTDPLEALTDEQLAKYDFYLDCGLQDTTVGTGNTIRVHEYLESRGKAHFYELRDGIHGSAFYMGSMDKSMKMHSEHFKRNGAIYQQATLTASNVSKLCNRNEQSFKLSYKTNSTGKVTFKSDNKQVKVDAKGKVTIPACFIGKAAITISVAEKQYEYTAATKKVTVTVLPRAVALKSVKNVKGKKLEVKWQKNTSFSGYQIQYSTDKNFVKDRKTVTISKQHNDHTTLKKLSKGKTYYVRVRTYQKTSQGNFYSEWSSTMKAAVKK